MLLWGMASGTGEKSIAILDIVTSLPEGHAITPDDIVVAVWKKYNLEISASLVKLVLQGMMCVTLDYPKTRMKKFCSRCQRYNQICAGSTVK